MYIVQLTYDKPAPTTQYYCSISISSVGYEYWEFDSKKAAEAKAHSLLFETGTRKVHMLRRTHTYEVPMYRQRLHGHK